MSKSQLNGELVLLPYVHPLETLMIYRTPGNATVVESSGLVLVRYTRQGFLNISLSTLFYNATCGLCGLFNGNASDDLRLPNGRLAESPELFTEGWRAIADDLTCNGDCDDLYRMCTDLRLYQSPWMCGNINDPGNSSFLACHGAVNPSPFFRNCLYNMCVREGNRSALCSSLQAYASACQDAQVGLAAWRSATNCRELVPRHHLGVMLSDGLIVYFSFINQTLALLILNSPFSCFCLCPDLSLCLYPFLSLSFSFCYGPSISICLLPHSHLSPPTPLSPSRSLALSGEQSLR